MWIRPIALAAALGLTIGAAIALQSPAADAPVDQSIAAGGSSPASLMQIAQVVTLPACKPGQIC